MSSAPPPRRSKGFRGSGEHERRLGGRTERGLQLAVGYAGVKGHVVDVKFVLLIYGDSVSGVERSAECDHEQVWSGGAGARCIDLHVCETPSRHAEDDRLQVAAGIR